MKQCLYCRYDGSKHHPSCPEIVPDNIVLWQWGYDDAYAGKKARQRQFPYVLGWAIGDINRPRYTLLNFLHLLPFF
jgi:hypothetical protein